MFNGAIFDDLGKRFKVKPGDDISLDDKLSLVKFMFAAAVVNIRLQKWFLRVKNYPR